MEPADCAHPFDLLLEIDRACADRPPAPTLAESLPAGAVRGLAVRVGEWGLLVPLDAINEIVPVPRLTEVPLARPWLLGVGNLRGRVLPIVDLRAFLGGGASAAARAARVLVVGSDGWISGLLVDEVIGLRHFETDAAVEGLDGVADVLRPYVDQAFSKGAELWVRFSLQQLLAEPSFLQAAG